MQKSTKLFGNEHLELPLPPTENGFPRYRVVLFFGLLTLGDWMTFGNFQQRFKAPTGYPIGTPGDGSYLRSLNLSQFDPGTEVFGRRPMGIW